MALDSTPRANRLHLGIFGKVNTGKSTFLNTMTDQKAAIVSNIAGTTTDPIYKAMELAGIGPVVWIDTAGTKDETTLSAERQKKTLEAAKKTDLAFVLFEEADITEDLAWIEYFRKKKTPVLPIINQHTENEARAKTLQRTLAEKIKEPILVLDVANPAIRHLIRKKILERMPESFEAAGILDRYVTPGDVLMFVMPQDIQAPKGRLILPQVQSLRNALDLTCSVLCCTTDQFNRSLAALKEAPALIVCDSQVIQYVAENCPEESRLTTFSILFSAYKGDLAVFRDGIETLERLPKNSRILIAEACTHAPMHEDIGRVKIPRLLKKKISPDLVIDFTTGVDFPADLASYDLIIHCGACMFNRKYVLSRIAEAQAAGTAITNYGMVLAYLTGSLAAVNM